MGTAFELDARIAEDTVLLGFFPLSEVRLHRDARYPWVLLVPARPDIREIHDLDPEDRLRLVEESSAIARAMQSALGAEKMNVAALGNMVPQLHLHHVARYTRDDAWPGPIWGRHAALEYTPELLAERVELLQRVFGELDGFAAVPVDIE